MCYASEILWSDGGLVRALLGASETWVYYRWKIKYAKKIEEETNKEKNNTLLDIFDEEEILLN